jgi:Family of unknown function (DUF6049)
VTARARFFAALFLAALVVPTAAAYTAVGAPPVAAQSTSPTFALAQQSPWIAPGADFSMRFDATGVPAGAEVALTVHDALQSRTAFDSSIGGDNLPPTRARQTFPFDALPVDPTTGQRVLTYPSGALGDNGVFPLEVDLRSVDDDSLAHFVTHVVVAPVGADGALTVGQPLNVAWVWPLQADPAYLANGVINLTTADDLALDGRLGRQSLQLLANTDVPLTIAPSPETVESWEAMGKGAPELAGGATVLRAAATGGGNQVLAGPYVPLDLPSIVRGGLQEAVTSVAGTRPGELTRGVATLEQFLGAHVDPSTALPGHLDTASLGILQSASVRQLVVDDSALVPVTEKYTHAHPYKMQTTPGDDSTAVTVLATDDGLEQFLSGDQPPALRAAHLLAGLALVAGEQPSVERGVAIVNPVHWDADNAFVSAVLDGLRNNPLVRPTTVAGLLQTVPVATVDGEPDAAPVYRQLAAYAPPLPPVTLAEYQTGVDNRNAVAELVPASDARVQNADRALATSLTSAWANPAGRKQASALLTSIAGSVDTYLQQVEVQPPSTITVTSSKAEIPISFRNNSDDDITVHLKLESNRLLFPDGAEQNVLLPHNRNTTVRVAVETRGSGTAPVQMTVTTPGGLAIGVPTTIKVRSSFVSGVGIFLTVGAIVFLVLWWGWDIHRRRKKRSKEQHPTYRFAPPSGQPA